MLLLYRRVVVFRGEPYADLLVWLMAGGYFLVWTLFGVAAYAAGAAIALAAMQWTASRASWCRWARALALIASGIYQLTPWKSACLTHCRNPLEIVARHLHPGWRGRGRARGAPWPVLHRRAAGR